MPAGGGATIAAGSGSAEDGVNGDDDIPESIMGGTDWGGGMYDTPDPIPDPDIEDESRFNKRRTQRRHPRPKFRSERKARRTPR